VDLATLTRASLEELESIYVEARPLAIPRGRFLGTVLQRLSNRGANHPLWRGSERLGFELLAFGVDFDRRLWLFTRRQIAMGRFDPRLGRSRWRETETVQLHYESSRLPRFVSRALYDEVKPLSDELCLGLGGINAGRGFGDHFFFALRAT
jgi:hypothetical protein